LKSIKVNYTQNPAKQQPQLKLAYMESLRLILGGVQLAIQFITVIIAIDLWRSSRRYHALMAVFALTVMIAPRVIGLLILMNVNLSQTILDLDTIVLPLIISILWYLTVTTSKQKVDHGSRT
jgi:hypothetical protein